MNYKEIESLKSVLMQFVKGGCELKNDEYNINGRIVGMGFKPYWTNPVDSKIEKLEFNYRDESGRITPFYLYNIVDYKIEYQDEERLEDSKTVTLDMHVCSHYKSKEAEPYENVRIMLNGK